MEIIFLGTSGSLPTGKRSLPSLLIKREGTLVLIDCGEGTQRQMMKMKTGFNKKMYILISHMHGDHVLGLPGLIQSMNLLGRSKPLDVYGPEGIRGFMKAVDKHVPYNANFQVRVDEFSGNPVLDEEFIIKGKWTRHSVPTLCFSLIEKPKPGKFNPDEARKLRIPEGPLWKRLQSGKSIILKGRKISPRRLVGPSRPGKKIVYSSDTRPCRSVVSLAKAADLLIHECTFSDAMADKAKAYLHSTSVEAAETAVKAGVKRLVLIHISSMYDEEEEEKMLKEAKEVFPETVLAQDLMRIEV